MATEGDLPRKLDLEEAINSGIPRYEMKKSLFDEMHGQDRMAREKLDEGIAGFCEAIETLERRLRPRLGAL